MAEDYYEVLGIRPRATHAEIELALKGRRSQYHPDRYGGMDAETVAWATARMQAVNEAYRVLSDPSRRSTFDANRTTARPETARPPSSDEGGKQAPRSASRPSSARDAPRRPVILDYLTRLDLEAEDTKRFHLAPDIPAKKLAAALSGRRFAQTAPPSAVHLLVDDTTFRGGADGLLITDEYVSFKSMFMDSEDFRYDSSAGWSWQGGFQAHKGTIRRQHLKCQGFSFFSASGVQKLVWALNSFFDDRLQWHLAMAEEGNVDSQFFLSGSLEDTAASRHWLAKAAEAGHVVAQHNLGAMCMEQDLEAAYRWFTMAASQGSARAVQRLTSTRFDRFRENGK